MVEIKYCPQCQKAKREHLFKTLLCQFCGSEMISIEARRTRYFYFMLPFLLLGAIFHLYAVYRLSASDTVDTAVIAGLVLLGIGMYIIAIGFQVLDSKQMEREAIDIGTRRAKKPGRASMAGKGPTELPNASGSTLRVRRPRRPAVMGPPAVEGSMNDEPDQPQKEEPVPEPTKKDIPIRRPKEKGPAREASKKEAVAPVAGGGPKTKKGKPSGPKAAKTAKPVKHSPPKARKILTR